MEKQRWEESERRSQEVKKSEKRKSEKEEDAGAREGRKVAIHCVCQFVQWFVAAEGRKVGSLKRRVRSHLAKWEMKSCTLLWRETHFEVKSENTSRSEHFELEMLKKCTLLWREANFEVKSVKNWRSRTTFWSWAVEKVYAVVAWSTFSSQNGKSTTCSDHFWTLRCRKCTPWWREANFQFKMYKASGSPRPSQSTFGSWDVEKELKKKVHAVLAQSTFPSQKCQKVTGSDHFWGSDVEKVHAIVARSTFRSQKCKKIGFRAFFDVQMSKSAHWLTNLTNLTIATNPANYC